ncbi:MAG: hypothetical protein EKK49_05840 [Rhodocyclaceae bacterium]|nr:MAG: hypothetical protein EKK49_05840 [Rhodocyclaceae bacterium]
MNFSVHIPLHAQPEQLERLSALQRAVAEVCNALAPVVRDTRCWNRVGLHHLAYRSLRERFPQVGSQMVCNAIYSVSRTCRLLFQHPQSPFNVARNPDKPLPLLQFQPSLPVYFDRHTLSVKVGQLSMYTLDGRMKFQLDLTDADVQRFKENKLREIVLTQTPNGYRLSFTFAAPQSDGDDSTDTNFDENGDLPEYVLVSEDTPLPHPAADAPQPASI